MTTPTPNTEMISRAEKIANLGFKDNSFKFVADCYKNNIDDSFLTNKKKLDRLDQIKCVKCTKIVSPSAYICYSCKDVCCEQCYNPKSSSNCGCKEPFPAPIVDGKELIEDMKCLEQAEFKCVFQKYSKHKRRCDLSIKYAQLYSLGSQSILTHICDNQPLLCEICKHSVSFYERHTHHDSHKGTSQLNSRSLKRTSQDISSNSSASDTPNLKRTCQPGMTSKICVNCSNKDAQLYHLNLKILQLEKELRINKIPACPEWEMPNQNNEISAFELLQQEDERKELKELKDKNAGKSAGFLLNPDAQKFTQFEVLVKEEEPAKDGDEKAPRKCSEE